MDFFLGTHKPVWLGSAGVPLFISARRLRERPPPAWPRAIAPWAIDSGGFTELTLYGAWRTPPGQYAREARAWAAAIGPPEFLAQQDWMCEGDMVARTGLDVATHQRLSLGNYLDLVRLAPELPWLPVLQGWEPDDYTDHARQYRAAGVDLVAAPRVGVGSICRRQGTPAALGILRALWRAGLCRLHAFGLKTQGLRRLSGLIASADSLAWSQDARRDASRVRRGHAPRYPCPAGRHSAAHKSGCANCLPYALAWRRRLLDSAGGH